MSTDPLTDHRNNDAQLNMLMQSWQTPSVPPGLSARVTARLLEPQTKREPLFPWSPMKLAAATAAAAVIGIVLGATMPTSEAVADTSAIIEQLW